MNTQANNQSSKQGFPGKDTTENKAAQQQNQGNQANKSAETPENSKNNGQQLNAVPNAKQGGSNESANQSGAQSGKTGTDRS